MIFGLRVTDGAVDERNLVFDLSWVRLLDNDGLVFELVEYRHSVSEKLAVPLCLDQGIDFVPEVPSENTIVEDTGILATIFASGILLLLYEVS